MKGVSWPIKKVEAPLQVPSHDLVVVEENSLKFTSLTSISRTLKNQLLNIGLPAWAILPSMPMASYRVNTNCLLATMSVQMHFFAPSQTGEKVHSTLITVLLCGRGQHGLRSLVYCGYTPFTVRVIGEKSQHPVQTVIYGDKSVAVQPPMEGVEVGRIVDVECWEYWPF